MRITHITTIASAMAILLVSTMASAQYPAIQLEAAMGYHDAFGDDADDWKMDGGMVGGVAVDVRIMPMLALGLGASYGRIDSDYEVLYTIDKYETTKVEGRIKLYVPSIGVEHGGLYAIVAMGHHSEEISGKVALIGTKFSRESEGFYGSIGAGLSLMVVPHLMVGAEARLYMNTWKEYDDNDDDHVNIDDLNYWSVMGTMTFVIPLIGK